MYRITRKLEWVLDRLHGFAHHPTVKVELEASERFLLTFALMEKLIRRTLTELIQIKDGQLTQHDITEKQKNVDWGNVEGWWRKYDPKKRKLSEVLGNNGEFQKIETWARMRNVLVHGNVQKYGQEYEDELISMHKMLEHIKTTFEAEYNYCGWRGTKFT